MNRNRQLAVEADGVLAAKRKAARSLIRFSVRSLPGAKRPLPVHLPYADDAPEMTESDDYSAVRHDTVVAEPTECLGFACPKKSDECGHCELSKKGEEDEEDRKLARLIALNVLGAFAKGERKGAYLGQMLQATHYHDALHDLFFAASAFRGTRVTAGLRTRERMNLL